MKDSLNFFLPIMEEDDTSVISNRNELRSITNISSNGYYGYQPVVEKHIQNGINCEQSMEVQMSDSDIQFNNFIPVEENCQQQKETMDNRDKLKRKRCWGYDYETEYPEFKKWRENVPTPNCHVHLSKPTHNIPDLPRCLTGHYI
ncbi:uncharacterized protein LOC108737996 isoform X3 [Agrilus planipennis]|uniref:Uncharacterized protein LOC108737996 isoform X3 n=1 Tax=Agrilus planipennis TaxID=224129 RepID=A0A1W4X2T6_AGRPL|nr:uncharacterized protein LOC108737996 isoform X3 [Agrilus planipennis]